MPSQYSPNDSPSHCPLHCPLHCPYSLYSRLFSGRNLRNAAGQVYIWRMQSEATDPTDIPRERLRRPEAADYCQRRLGQSVKPNTLRGWRVPYRQVGRDAVYELADLDRFIDARLAAADVRLAGRHARSRRKINRASLKRRPKAALVTPAFGHFPLTIIRGSKRMNDNTANDRARERRCSLEAMRNASCA